MFRRPHFCAYHNTDKGVKRMKNFREFFHLQNLRKKAGSIAAKIEIILAFIMITGIAFILLQVCAELKEMFLAVINEEKTPPFSDFLAMIFSLVIGLEFIKMLVKQTPSSAIEVVLFATARKIITDHGSMFETFLGVISIALLFAVDKYLTTGGEYDGIKETDYIVNGGTSIREINRRLDADFDEAYGNTVAGYLFNYLKRAGKAPALGLETVIGNYGFTIQEMDNDLIRYIKIIKIDDDKPEKVDRKIREKRK